MRPAVRRPHIFISLHKMKIICAVMMQVPASENDERTNFEVNVMEQSQDLLEQINALYKSFSKGQKRIANYITENYDSAVNLTAAKLGKIVGVSESTVVRFATELGFKGYPQFQDALEEIVKNKLNSIQRIRMTTNNIEKSEILHTVLQSDKENIKRTRDDISKEEFEKALNLISDADHIYVVGGRSCEPLSHFMAYYLNYIFADVKLVDSGSLAESFEDIHRIGPEDVVFGITFPRYSVDTVKIVEFSKNRGARIIALTDSAVSPLTKYADCVLYAKSDMVSFADSLVAPLSVINALIAGLSIQNNEKVLKTMEGLEKIWKEFSVYADKKDHE